MKRLAKIAGVAASLGAGLLVASCSSGADDTGQAQGDQPQAEHSELTADQPTLTEVAEAQRKQTPPAHAQQPEGAESHGKVQDPRAVPPPRPDGKVDFAAFLEEVEPGGFDPLSLAVADGIVWYGTWEAAMAEYERTGKPVMLHFGSPRCPDNEVCVPGTW
jgi:outer membrane murein-binding lipoprotein Lpp